ncbi:MAG: tetratricopeptide repeat protein [Actinomycetota bacterium]|nr:tetratricopeptide repeat protein [Actinomycetota bacterium]
MQGERVDGPVAETIGQRLKRLRLERGLSQRELAGPGVSYAYISRIEAGARRPSVKALRTLAPKLGVSVEYLETGSDLREVDERELRLADAELQLRLAVDPTEAEQMLRSVLEEGQRSGDLGATTRALIALGLSAGRRGDHAEAVQHLERALGDSPVSLMARPDVYSALGRSYAAVGQPARAAELFERCLKDVQDGPDHDAAAEVRFATELSYALADMGDLDRAHSVLEEALARAEDFADPYTRIRLYWSLGRLAARGGNPTAALSSFRRAVALLEATEDTLHLARSHLSCAWILNASDRAEEAGSHLEAAERLFGHNPDALDLAYLRTEQAKRAVRLGEPDEAVAQAQEALDVLGESDPAERGNAYLALAEGLVAKGDKGKAEDAFKEAVQLLEQHGQRRECAEAMRAWAKFLRAEGREVEALDVLERAAENSAAAEPAKAPTRT